MPLAAFTETINLGTVILGALIAFATVVGIAYGVRYRTAYEAANGRANQLHEWLNEALDREKRLHAMVGEQRMTIEELQKLPNLASIVEAMHRQENRHATEARKFLEHGLSHVGGLFHEHEQQALERHEGIVTVLAGIAATLERANTA